jgi:hypothetical protein
MELKIFVKFLFCLITNVEFVVRLRLFFVRGTHFYGMFVFLTGYKLKLPPPRLCHCLYVEADGKLVGFNK